MNPVYRAKPAVWTKPIPFFGGRLQTVNLDGNVYEVKKHKMNGLHLQQFHYPLLDIGLRDSFPSDSFPSDSFPKENVSRSAENVSRSAENVLRSAKAKGPYNTGRADPMQVKELKIPVEKGSSEPIKSLQGRGPKVTRTKKNISSILRGGALAPL